MREGEKIQEEVEGTLTVVFGGVGGVVDRGEL